MILPISTLQAIIPNEKWSDRLKRLFGLRLMLKTFLVREACASLDRG